MQLSHPAADGSELIRGTDAVAVASANAMRMTFMEPPEGKIDAFDVTLGQLPVIAHDAFSPRSEDCLITSVSSARPAAVRRILPAPVRLKSRAA